MDAGAPSQHCQPVAAALMSRGRVPTTLTMRTGVGAAVAK
jgi:hypothetical protein